MSLFGYASHLMKSGRVPSDAPDFQLAQRTFAQLRLMPDDELRARHEYAQLITTLAYARERNASHQEAIRFFDLAAKLWHDLNDRRPSVDFSVQEANMLSAMAAKQCHILRDYNRAVVNLAQAEKIMEAAIAMSPAVPDRSNCVFALGNMLGDEAYCRHCLGQRETATQLYQRTVDTFEEAIGNEPVASPQREKLGRWYFQFAQLLLEAQGPGAAIDRYKRSAQIWEQLLKENALPDGREIVLADAYCRIAQCNQAQGNHADAMTAYRRCVEIGAPLMGKRVENKKLRSVLSDSYIQLASLIESDGGRAEAVELYRCAAPILRKQSRNEPTNARWQQ
jgi:tetratricopeptide (TPR) repeat protein